MQSIHLQGSEEVARAARDLRAAAEEVSRAAASFAATLEQQQRFLDDWIERLADLLRAKG